jgi:hypothetical protein
MRRVGIMWLLGRRRRAGSGFVDQHVQNVLQDIRSAFSAAGPKSQWTVPPAETSTRQIDRVHPVKSCM